MKPLRDFSEVQGRQPSEEMLFFFDMGPKDKQIVWPSHLMTHSSYLSIAEKSLYLGRVNS